MKGLDGAELTETLDFYVQVRSIEATVLTGAVIAGTLANAGVCPTTRKFTFFVCLCVCVHFSF